MEKDNKNLLSKNITLYLFLFLMGLLLYKSNAQINKTIEVPYSEFQQLLEEKKISNLEISEKVIRGEFINKTGEKSNFFTNRIDPNLVHELEKANTSYRQIQESHLFATALSWILPVFIFYFVWFFLVRRFSDKVGPGGSLFSVGKSKAKLYVETQVKISFADVAGIDEAKQELREVVDFLKNPKEFEKLGARMPKGILLVGPPGTGKTLLAKSVAGEAQVPFFSISGSEFVEMFVGVGAARVRDLFSQARQKAPCIIFIDELDSLGKTRTGIINSGIDEKEQTLNQLLAELDGFDTITGIVLLAATNRPEILDPALLRSGRFDRQILLDRPDKIGREAILKIHIKKIKIDPKLNIEPIAALTPGFSGADLANLVNEAALQGTREHSEFVTEKHFTVAIERLLAGIEKKTRIYTPKEKRIIAYHEMGHTIVASAIPGSDQVHKVSIIARGIGSLGYTIQRPSEDRYLATKQELMNKMTILLGGRCSELLIFNEISTGAADDLVKVNNIAKDIITKYGMSNKMGVMVFLEDKNSLLQGYFPGSELKPHSEEILKMIDFEIKAIIDEAEKKSLLILEKNKSLLVEGAEFLMEKETLDEAEVKAIVSKVEQI